MDDRELEILAALIESNDPFYLAPDRSDVYALAPTNMTPGLLRIPGEYTGLTDLEVEALVVLSMLSNNWEHVPYTVRT